jgi:hypothetical protein
MSSPGSGLGNNPNPPIVATSIISGTSSGAVSNSRLGIGHGGTLPNATYNTSAKNNLTAGNGLTVSQGGFGPIISVSPALATTTISCSELKLEPPNEYAYQSLNRVHIWGSIVLSTLYEFNIFQKFILRLIGISVKQLRTQAEWLDIILAKATELKGGTLIVNNDQMSLISGDTLSHNALCLHCGEIVFIQHGDKWYKRMHQGISELSLTRKNKAKFLEVFSRFVVEQVNATSD